MYYAAIDLGTNSCRLLMAQCSAGRLQDACRYIISNRLGEGLYSSGIISEKAMGSTLACLEEFKLKMQQKGAQRFHIIATSAVREAKNQEQFIQFLHSNCALVPEIIDGQREARLTYSGIIKEWPGGKDPLVIDLGGGSTELIWLDQGTCSISLPVGAVRATEAAMNAADAGEILSAIKGYKNRLEEFPLVMAGGTVTTLAAIKLALDVYDAGKVQGEKMTREEIADIYNLLCRIPLSVRRRLPGLQPERADIIVKGAMIVLLLMDLLGKEEMTVSENDILNGVIWELYAQEKHN